MISVSLCIPVTTRATSGPREDSAERTVSAMHAAPHSATRGAVYEVFFLVDAFYFLFGEFEMPEPHVQTLPGAPENAYPLLVGLTVLVDLR